MIADYHFLADQSKQVMYDGKPLSGATLSVKLTFFRGTEEIDLSGPELDNVENLPFVTDLVRVSFDRDAGFKIQPAPEVVNVFKRKLNADRMEIYVLADGYAIDVEVGALKDSFPDLGAELSDELASAPLSSGCPVSGSKFQAFLREHADIFDIPGNYPAQAL